MKFIFERQCKNKCPVKKAYLCCQDCSNKEKCLYSCSTHKVMNVNDCNNYNGKRFNYLLFIYIMLLIYLYNYFS